MIFLSNNFRNVSKRKIYLYYFAQEYKIFCHVILIRPNSSTWKSGMPLFLPLLFPAFSIHFHSNPENLETISSETYRKSSLFSMHFYILFWRALLLVHGNIHLILYVIFRTSTMHKSQNPLLVISSQSVLTCFNTSTKDSTLWCLFMFSFRFLHDSYFARPISLTYNVDENLCA